MKTIWKFPLATTTMQEIVMPIGAEPIHVETQQETPCLWAIVDPLMSRSNYTVYTFGIGHPIVDDCEIVHCGTYQLRGGALVFHVFMEAAQLEAGYDGDG